MAKKTKDSNLSIEERLEQAVIPNWDEPYKLPENWCWVKLDSISEILNGYAFKSSLYKTSGIRIIRITNVQDGFIEDEKPVFYPFNAKSEIEPYVLKSNDLLMSLTGNVGRVALMKEEFLPAALNQRVACLRMKSSTINTKYLFYCLLQKQFIDDCTKASKGSAQLNMSTEWLKGYSIPLPPIYEQLRIVERIESLFTKLDEASEKAREVIDGFETRKASILHKAFSGELTAKWRDENNISLEDWKNQLFDECIEKMQNGLAKRSGSEGVPYVVLRLANLSDDGFITDDLREIVLDEKEQKSYKLNIGDVVMIRVNGSKDNVAKQILVTENNLWAFCDHIIRIKYNESVLPAYMVLYSKSETYKIYVKDNIVSSAGQNTISRKGMVRLNIPVPPIDEQKEIVNILLDMFAKERSVKETATAVIEQIDTMKKAILSRAFRGELGTNDPSEESALELLKRVLESK